MVFFDYLYLKVYKFYSSFNDKSAQSTAAAIVGGLITMNILTLLFFIDFILDNNALTSEWLIIFLFLFFQVITYYRYLYQEKHSVTVIENKLSELPKSKKETIKIIHFIYWVVSLVLFFGSAIFIGSFKVFSHPLSQNSWHPYPLAISFPHPALFHMFF